MLWCLEIEFHAGRPRRAAPTVRSAISDKLSGARKETVMKTLVLACFVVLGAAAIITRGNAGPPGSYRWRNLPQALAKGESTTGGVDVEVVPDDQLSGRMRLIIPLKKQNAPGEE